MDVAVLIIYHLRLIRRKSDLPYHPWFALFLFLINIIYIHQSISITDSGMYLKEKDRN